MKMAAEPAFRKQRGVALLTALVILAIAATLAAGMIWELSLNQHRTANLILGDQAMQYALGAEAWSEQILRRDVENAQRSQPLQTTQQTGTGQASSGNSVNLTQDWAMHLPPLPVQGGTVTGQMQDLQGLFNLNNLVSAQASPTTQSTAFTQFQRLLTNLNLDPGIAFAVLDWVNQGDQPHFPGGAKDETYSRLQPPYLTAERPMTSISELLLVAGVTPEVFQKLEPYVCALPLQVNNNQNNPNNPNNPDNQSTPNIPGNSNDPNNPNTTPQNPQSAPQTGNPLVISPVPVNVNTAPPMVLMSLAPSIDLGTATALAQALAMHPIENQSALAGTWSQLTNGQRLPSNVGVTSNYFRLTVKVTIGSAHLTMYSLLYRNSTGGTFVIRRTFGTL